MILPPFRKRRGRMGHPFWWLGKIAGTAGPSTALGAHGAPNSAQDDKSFAGSQGELGFGFGELGYGEFEVFVGVGGGDLGADSGFAVRDDRI